tara:strand:- start:7586 stop:8596 length:1011 start_codon:yes stop_codon:yes gene_type:complete
MNLQEPPNAIQIEPTEGCNLACSFCGIAGIRDNKANGPDGKHGKKSSPFKFMDVITARELARQIASAGWTSRIEFAMHGEPTMNQEIENIIKIFREALPNNSIMMTSNGGGLLKGKGPVTNIKKLMKVGLNVLLLDHYEHSNFVDIIEEKLNEDKENTSSFDVLYYPLNSKANPHQRRKPHQHHVVITKDITEASKGNHASLNNHCGNAFPPNESAKEKRCAKPFREMSIRWDGNVAICCNDWRGTYKCGNILEKDINVVWNNKFFKAARRKLYHRQRDFGPCRGCDATSYRVGLLPDKMGKKELPLPTITTDKNIHIALSGDPYTKPVKRPWEKM